MRITVCDLRESALKVAERFSAAELGSPARTVKADARELHALGEEFDAALLYGLSTPHSDAFAMVELLASASESLADDGLLLVEEGDRFYNMAILSRYRDVVYEGDEERGVLSMGAGYDALRGVVRRLYINPFTGERAALELRYWDLASTLALAWLFFEDIDFVGYAGRAYTGMILARSPRKRLRPGDLKRPRCLAQLPRGV